MSFPMEASLKTLASMPREQFQDKHSFMNVDGVGSAFWSGALVSEKTPAWYTIESLAILGYTV